MIVRDRDGAWFETVGHGYALPDAWRGEQARLKR